MAKVPNKIEKFKALEDDLSTSIATALWKKAADLTEYINQSRPIGMLMFFNDTQSLLPSLPDPRYWKECDGTAVSNVNSPLNGVVLPDFRSLYIKGLLPGAGELGVAGHNSVDFSHNHLGTTEFTSITDSLSADDDNEVPGPFLHAHMISASLGVVDTRVSYKEFRIYMRIV